MISVSIARSLALPIVLSAGLLAGCEKPAQKDPRVDPPVVRTAVVESAGGSVGTFTGTVVARVESDLGFRVPGKVIARYVDLGETVKKGQALMRIDPTDLKLATIAQEGNVAAAQAKADQTTADAKRYADLVTAGAVSASAYDQAKAAADAAQAQLRAAQAQAGVIANSMSYAQLVADTDGVVTATLAEPGQVVAAGQPVIRLAKGGAREALVNLPETVRPALGATALATVFGSAQREQPVTLRELSSAANPLGRTFEARYVLQGDAAKAPLGSTVTVRLPVASSEKSTEVALSAIFDRGQGPGVWLVAGSPVRVQWHPVQIASLTSEAALIRSGLLGGERYVSLGAHMLHDSQVVRLESTGSVK